MFCIDYFNFCTFNGQSILSGRSTVNTKKGTWISLQVLILYISFIYLVLSCVFITKYNYCHCSVINKLGALSVAIM